VNTINPHQVPRLREIQAGRKFWGYLDTEAFRSRYVLAAHFVRHARHIVEIGGYRDNLITNFLTGQHESVSVYSLDAEFEPTERESLNGAPCRVRHVRDYFQHHLHPSDTLAVVALGLEIHGGIDAFHGLIRDATTTVVEIPVDHRPSVDCLNALLASVPLRVRCQINLDLSPNDELLREELRASSMNPPFWRRHVSVLDAAGASS
jgi:hypothetical protein